MLTSPFVSQNSRLISNFALQHRLPAISPFHEFVRAGGLLAYGPDLPLFFRAPAVFIDKILKGAKPGDLPIVQPTKFTFGVNLRTAKALGIEMPLSLLINSDEVID